MLLALQKLKKLVRGGREKFLAAINDPDRADEFGHVERNGGKNARFDFPDHAGLRKDADTGLDRDRVFDRFNVVEFHRDVDIHATLAQRLVDCAANAQTAVEGGKGLAFNRSLSIRRAIDK